MDALARVKSSRLLRPLLGYIYDRRFVNNTQGQLFRGVFDSFSAAAASAPNTLPIGYDQPASAAMYRDRLDQVRDTDYPILYWWQRAFGQVRRVFDYGGHIGLKWYGYRRYLTFPDDLTWTVCDVPAVARAGTELARERGARGLSFTSDFEAVDGSDVLLCLGSLQYIEPALADQLRPIARKPRHVVVSGVPFTDGASFVTLNSIGTAFCPYKVMNQADFLSGMKGLGYELVDQWAIPGKACIVPLHPDRSVHQYTGMYLRLPG